MYNIISEISFTKQRDKTGKEHNMDEGMNTAELLKETAEENQIRKILEIMRESKNLGEAIEKVKALLEK